MVRLLKVYYSFRTLVILAGEGVIVWASFLLGALLQNRDDSRLLLNVDVGSVKILAVTAMGLLIPIAALVVWRTE